MEYPYVIVTHERAETLFSIHDFELLLDQKLGDDAVKYLHRLLVEDQEELIDG